MPLIGKAGERYVAHALPLASRAGPRTGQARAATAAIFIHEASLAARPPPAAIAEAYGLTMTELRVLFAIVDIGGVPEVAETLGIAASTVISAASPRDRGHDSISAASLTRRASPARPISSSSSPDSPVSLFLERHPPIGGRAAESRVVAVKPCCWPP